MGSSRSRPSRPHAAVGSKRPGLPWLPFLHAHDAGAPLAGEVALARRAARHRLAGRECGRRRNRCITAPDETPSVTGGRWAVGHRACRRLGDRALCALAWDALRVRLRRHHHDHTAQTQPEQGLTGVQGQLVLGWLGAVGRRLVQADRGQGLLLRGRAEQRRLLPALPPGDEGGGQGREEPLGRGALGLERLAAARPVLLEWDRADVLRPGGSAALARLPARLSHLVLLLGLLLRSALSADDRDVVLL